MAAAGEGNGVVKGQGGVGQLDLDGMGLEKAGHLRFLLLGDHRDDLQHPVGVASHQTGCDGGGDALQSAGVGYNDAFDVFDQVSADLDGDGIGETAQLAAGHRRTIGQSNGLGAAHGRHQLLPQDL